MIFETSRLKKILVKFFCTIILATFCLSATAQGSLSASTKKTLYTIKKFQQTQRFKKIELTPEVKKELNITSSNKVQYIGGLIKINPATVDMPGLHSLGVVINTKAGDIWSVQVPVETLENISSIKGIEAVDVGGKMKLLLDKARKDVKADEVHQGIKLSKAYLGENVVVGIIDIGFDYTHPTFYDPVTKKNRISRVWNQNYVEEDAGLGLAPPTGYNYGMELTNLQQIIESIDPSEYNNETKKLFLFDGQDEIHGTHVAGIATGSGWDTQDKYQGIAPKAEIVMVTFKDADREESSDLHDLNNAYSNNVIDAIQYIYNYAASVNKPAVINFSAGMYLGPHDGTSLLCQGINNLTGEGKIMVAGAGNDGNSVNHLSHTFTTMDEAFTLLGYYKEGEFYTDISGYTIDCWASAGTDFSAKVMVYKDKKKVGETKFIAASLNKVVTDTIYEGTDTAFVKSSTEYLNPNNNRPNILVEITTNNYPAPLSVHLAFKGENTQVHAWSKGFSSTGEAKYIAGDDLYTIADGQTAKNVIAVGAYATMNKFVNLNNQEQNFEKEMQIGNILSFSSKGPTTDGLTKPDITAPGFIVSSISSFTNAYNASNDVYSQVSPVNGRTYKYAAMYGTSMSSPVVTGAVALMLEANPKLDPQQVLDILKTTAREDEFTGDIPITGSNTWGWGKLDILAAVKSAETNTKMFKEPNKVKVSVPFIYPNPATNTITITLPKKVDNKNCSYYILDEFGKQLMSNKASSGFFSIPIHHLPKGVYLIKITDNKTNTLTNKFIKQ